MIRSTSRRNRPNGFSLIELVIVLVLMAMCAAFAVHKSQSALTRLSLARACETIERFDSHLRRNSLSMRSTIEAEIDASTSRLIVVSPHREEFRLGDGVTIDQIRVPSQTPSSSLRRLKLRCSDQGVTPTYAIQLSCGKLSRWIGFVGVSGQVIDQLDDNEIVAVMSVE